MRIVIDTNVFVAALRSGGGASRQVLRHALNGLYRPLFSNPLWLEYEDLLGRPVWTAETTAREREQVLMALAAAGDWVNIYTTGAPTCPMKAITTWLSWLWQAERKPS